MTRLYADFNNADPKGRVRLNCYGTLQDLKKLKIQLSEGMKVILDDNDELSTAGIVEYSKEENIWVAKIDWENFNRY
jgi:hypothetical protein